MRSNISSIIGITFCALMLFAPFAEAVPPKWTDWEHSNSVAREGQWLVVRQPDEGFCYIKQGYDGYSDKMDLLMKRDGIPFLTTPFYQGIQGDVSYWLDQEQVRIVRESKVSAFAIKLSPEIVSELKSGNVLTVRVKPIGRSTIEQRFNLLGFTAASKWLGSATCLKKVPDKH